MLRTLPLQSAFLPALLVLGGGLLVAGVAAACYWVYLDARARDLPPSTAGFWAALTVLGGLGGLYYLLVVRR
ncbi:hypothetical protein ACFQE1_17395, partial [Halobium palmae]